jgi:hypothetical protein
MREGMQRLGTTVEQGCEAAAIAGAAGLPPHVDPLPLLGARTPEHRTRRSG